MEQRINLFEKGQNAFKAMHGFGQYLPKSSIEAPLLHLIYFRVSQINGCAYCLDMHSKDLRAAGETEQRLYMVAGWREATVFTDREKAALAWAESVTNLHEGHVPDEVYALVSTHFSEQEIMDLTIGVIAINSYNRLNVAFRTPGGSYKVGQYAA